MGNNKKPDAGPNIKRREILKLMGLSSGHAIATGGLLGTLLDSVVNGLIQKAHAQSGGLNPRTYVYIQQPGAPSRWMYDLFLTPYGNQGFQQNAGVGTRFGAVGGRYVNLDYSTSQVLGLNVPTFWTGNVAGTNGNRPLSDLLRHMLQIRGVNAMNPGHIGARQLHQRPLGASQSITALPGDFSASNPFKAINNATRDYQFKSRRGNSAALISNGGNLVSKLLTPFASAATTDFKSKKALIKNALDIATQSIDAFARSENPAAETLVGSRQNADELIGRAFGDLDAQFNQMRARYAEIISATVLMPAPGANELPVGATGARNSTYQYGDGRIVNNPDLRSMIDGQTGFGAMAAQFALIEYIIKNELSRSISVSTPQPTQILVNNGRLAMIFDQHFVGGIPALYVNTIFYRALSACLLELTEQLKSVGKFDSTVIDVSGEFNRNPRNDRSGSDHGYLGASMALYSGLVQSPIVLGNIFNDRGGNYSGTWGEGAPVTGLNTQLDIGHWGSTIAQLIGVPSPITARNSIVNVVGNQVTPNIELAKQI